MTHSQVEQEVEYIYSRARRHPAWGASQLWLSLLVLRPRSVPAPSLSSALVGDEESHRVRLWRIVFVGRVPRHTLSCLVEVRGPALNVTPTLRSEVH